MALVGPTGQPLAPSETVHPGPGEIHTHEAEPGDKKDKADAPEPDWLATDEEGNVKIEFPVEVFDDRVVLKRDDRTSLTEGGLYLPDGARDRPMTGTIVSIGEGMLKGDGSRMMMFVHPGDRVVFEQRRQMIPISVNGFWYHILRQTDLLGRARGEVKIKGEKNRR
jgi:chaperonin GroES